jgi:uncharacterized protein YvpB
MIWIRYNLLLIILCLGLLSACDAIPADVPSSHAAQADSPGVSADLSGMTRTPSAQAMTVTPSPTMITQVTQKPADTATPESTATPSLPASYVIEDIYGYRQWFSLSCEARAAVDWAAYFGVTIYEYNFQHELPLSDNPDFGFVGTVTGPWGQVPPYAYGVHAEPVAALLREYGLPAAAYKKYTLEQVRAQIAAGKPVIAWVIGNVEGGVPYIYTDSAGNEVQVGAYEHVVILTGYGEDTIRYLNNSRFYDVPVEVFDNSWSVLDRMVIVMED